VSRPSTDPPDLTERYGAPSRATRLLVVTATAAVAVLGLVWLVWVTLFHGRPMVTSKLVGFDVGGEHIATARFSVVRRESDVRASCLLRAYADDHSIVGERTVPVTSGPTTRIVDAAVRTERRATALEVMGCTAPGQQQRR
jgi:hypothetical protein